MTCELIAEWQRLNVKNPDGLNEPIVRDVVRQLKNKLKQLHQRRRAQAVRVSLRVVGQEYPRDSLSLNLPTGLSFYQPVQDWIVF